MYSKSCSLYDALYRSRGKDYQKESAAVLGYLRRYKLPANSRLLDVACGTGNHLKYLKESFLVEGLDVSRQMVAIAKLRNPGIVIHRSSMVAFNLGAAYGIVTCLFSSIGFVRSERNLRKAMQSMSRHLVEGGVLLLEPWLFPEAVRPGGLHAAFVDEEDLKAARMSVVRIRGMDWRETDYFQVMTKRGVRRFRERLRMGLFSREQYEEAMRSAGLSVTFEPHGIIGRGLFIGVKESA